MGLSEGILLTLFWGSKRGEGTPWEGQTQGGSPVRGVAQGPSWPPTGLWGGFWVHPREGFQANEKEKKKEEKTQPLIMNLSNTAEQADRHPKAASTQLQGALPAPPYLGAWLRKDSGRGCRQPPPRAPEPFPPLWKLLCPLRGSASRAPARAVRGACSGACCLAFSSQVTRSFRVDNAV